MTTFLPQNQFNSAAPPAVDEAGASPPAPLCDAPATLSSSDDGVESRHAQGKPQGLAALSQPSNGAGLAVASAGVAPGSSDTEAAGSVRTAASDISDIPEIFRVANLLCEDARIFTPDYPSLYQAMLDDTAPRLRADDPVWADEAPLFLKSIG